MFYFDESNRLHVVKDLLSKQHYIYDASGERILKANSDVISVYQNGTPVSSSAVTINAYASYPSAFIVMDALGIYSKHYFAGSQRIASRVGDKNATYFDTANTSTVAPQGNTDTEDASSIKQMQVSNLRYVMEKEQLGTAVLGEYTPYSYEELQAIEAEGQVGTQAAGPGPNPTALPDIYYFHPDHLGSSTFLTDYLGKAYQFFLNLPFGETMAEQLPSTVYKTPYKFNGKELDAETGLYYYGARYYDPKISVWLSVDPLLEKFPNWNPYNYTMNNPINLIDPDGRSATPPNDYVFDQNGNFVRIEKNKAPHRLVVENSNTGARQSYKFADVRDASRASKSKLVFVSSKEMIGMMNGQEAFNKDNATPSKFKELSHSNFDYSYRVLADKYKNDGALSLPNSIPAPTVLFLPEGDNYVHNQGNFGNFLWGATGYTLGYNEAPLKWAAHYNSLFGDNGYDMQWDSTDDQLSISRGVNFAERQGLRNLVEEKPSDYNKSKKQKR